MVWIGETELQNNQIKIKVFIYILKNMYLKTEELVSRDEFINILKKGVS